MEHVLFVAGQLRHAFACYHLLVAEATLPLVCANLSINGATDPAACLLKIRLVRMSSGGRSLSD